MMRNIHFFNLKEGADEASVFDSLDVIIKQYTLERGCVDRRTLRLIDAHEGGEEVDAPQYMNESWWPDVETAMAAFSQEQQTPEFSEAVRKMREQIEIVRTVRYEEI